MRKPDLLILIAIWEFVTAFIAFIGAAAIIIIAFVVPSLMQPWDVGRPFVIFGLSIGIIVLLAYVGLAVVAGVGIIMGKEWGRVTSIIHAALSLFSVPFGTVIGVLSIIYLNKPEVKDYFLSAGKPTPQPVSQT